MIYYPQHYCFQPIKTSFYTKPFILMHGRTPRTLSLSLTCLNRPTVTTITQTIFVVHFKSGSFPHLGRPLDASSGICLPLAFNWLYLLITDTIPWATLTSSPKTLCWWEETFTPIWGHLDICPLLNQFHLASITHLELSSLTSLRAWGDVEKFCSNIAYLLLSTEDEAMSDRVYGLSTVWMNPYQARVSTVKEVVGQLTTLVSSGPNWPYTLVQLNGDTHHVPLPRDGHLCILTEGGTNSATCRWVSQLEVHQLLCSDSQVIYPIGLNGCKAPMIASPPKSLARGTNLLGGEPIYLKVGIPQFTAEESELKVPPSDIHPSILMASSVKATLPKAEREVSMTIEVRELQSWVVLDMSGHMSTNSTPKRLNPVVVLTPPVDTSSQVNALDDAEMEGASLEEILTIPLPIAETPGPSGDTPPEDADLLWEEANKALGELLGTKSSTNTCQWKLVGNWAWLFAEMSLKQQNLSRKPSQLQHSYQGRQRHLHLLHTGGQNPLFYGHQGSQSDLWPVPTPYRRLKPFALWPSGTQRPREPPKLAHFNNHMLSPSCVWKSKLLTSSLSVKLFYEPAL